MQAIIYIADEADFAKVLPKALEAIIAKQNRVLVYCADKKRLGELDNYLWSFEQLSFLPHVTEDDELQEETPILLAGTFEKANNRNVVVALEPKFHEEFKRFERMVYVHKNALENAPSFNEFINELKAQNIEITQYIKSQQGSWQKI